MATMMMNVEDNRTKLEKEVANLETFKELLSKSSKQTTQMSHILTHFDERLSKLECTISPVYRETGNLQNRQESIVNTLHQLDYVIRFYTVANQVEGKINAGPGSTQIDSYLEALNQLKEAIDYFDQNNRESPELLNVTALFDKGATLIEREFDQQLRRHSNPVPPVIINDLVREEETADDDKLVLEQLPEKAKNELKILAEWLCTNKNDDFIGVYAKIRGEVLVKSLQNLHDHLKSSSREGYGVKLAASGHDSPVVSRRSGNIAPPVIKGDTPTGRKATGLKNKLQHVITGEPRNKQAAVVPLEVRDDIYVSEREILLYVNSVTALYKLMQSELKLMSTIIPIEHQRPIFSRLVLPALQKVVGDGEALSVRVKKCVARHDFSSALNLFPILRHLAQMRHNFDLLFDGCSKEVTNKFQGLTVNLQTTINKALDEFVDHIKTHGDLKVPRDGTVHELTSNVMLFLVQLLEYVDILSRVITVIDLASLDNAPDKNRAAFAQYMSRVLSALGLTLQNKSEAYTDPHLKAIFKLNNYHYILKTLRKSGLLPIVHLYNPDIEAFYEDQILDNKRMYSQSWARVLNHILDVDTQPLSPSAYQNGQMKDKERQAIKDRFAGFNKEFEEVRRVQTLYAIPDPELKEQMKRNNQDFIIHRYQILWNKYYRTNFTKNPDKYLKYSPDQVLQLMDTFFDSAA